MLRGAVYQGSEEELHQYTMGLLRYTAKPNVLYLHIANQGKRSAVTGAHLKDLGMLPGAADFLVVVDGRAYFLELKALRGRQSAEQVVFEKAALIAGADYRIARSPEEAAAILREWGALR